MSVRGIDHVAITVDDVERAVRFYQNLVGAEVEFLDRFLETDFNVVTMVIGGRPRQCPSRRRPELLKIWSLDGRHRAPRISASAGTKGQSARPSPCSSATAFRLSTGPHLARLPMVRRPPRSTPSIPMATFWNF